MTDLKPCPFCGGEAEICRHALVSWVRCKKCGVDTPAALPQDEQLAIDFWNTRAERTCHIEGRYGNQYCTCCGEMVGTWDSTSELYIDGNMVELWNYCPNCGAKVVVE